MLEFRFMYLDLIELLPVIQLPHPQIAFCFVKLFVQWKLKVDSNRFRLWFNWRFYVIMVTDMQDRLEMFSSEEDLENASLYEPLNYVGVVFLDKMSYQLRFPHSQVPLPSDYTESIGKKDSLIKEKSES